MVFRTFHLAAFSCYSFLFPLSVASDDKLPHTTQNEHFHFGDACKYLYIRGDLYVRRSIVKRPSVGRRTKIIIIICMCNCWCVQHQNEHYNRSKPRYTQQQHQWKKKRIVKKHSANASQHIASSFSKCVCAASYQCMIARTSHVNALHEHVNRKHVIQTQVNCRRLKVSHKYTEFQINGRRWTVQMNLIGMTIERTAIFVASIASFWLSLIRLG